MNATDSDLLLVAALEGNVEVVQTLLAHGVNVSATDSYGWTALLIAARENNVEVVQTLLAHGVNVNATDSYGWTALLIAARENNVEVVQTLLAHGANVNATDSDGGTALFSATLKGNVEVVQTLLAHGANVNATKSDGRTALFNAAYEGNVEVVQTLLAHGANVNTITDSDGITALFFAAQGDNVEVVQTLLANGANGNATDTVGRTSLFSAALKGNVEVVQTLLAHGANVNVTDSDGWTALFNAADEGNVEVVQTLLAHGANVNATDSYGWTALLNAAQENNVEVVQTLLAHGGNVNATDSDGWTALLIAAQENNVEVVQTLLAHGANVNVTGSDGWTALLIAAQENNVEVVQTLLAHGANVNVTDSDGWTALFNAAHEGNVEVVQTLLAHGANVNVTGSDGWTALFFAAQHVSVEVVQTLLAHGANVNATGSNGRTALLIAAHEGNVEVVQTLLAHGANVNATDGDGRTALFSATLKGNVKVVQTLLAHGANVNATKSDGRTALFSAAHEGKVEVVQTLLAHGANVNATDRDGGTALFLAAYKDSGRAAQMLLAHGADVHKTLKDGWTALLIATLKGNVEVVQTLLAHGANVNATKSDGRTALFVAAQGGSVEVVQTLLAHGANVNVTDSDGWTALFSATLKGNVEVVQTLLAHGANVNVTDSDGWTALFSATFKRNVEVVQTLLAHGANVNATKSVGWTALFNAAHEGNVEVVQTLLAHGANVNATDRDGGTALFLAACKDSGRAAQMLLAHGADVHKTLKDGRTALFIASFHGSVGVVGTLLAHGANVNVADSQGITALVHAVYKDNVKVVQTLLAHGANVNATVGSDGKTALFFAAQNGSVEVAQTLLDHGANVNATVGSGGKTALFVAAQGGSVEVVQTLLAHGANVSATDTTGRTALFIVAEKGHIGVAEILLNQGAKVGITDHSGNPAIFGTAHLLSMNKPHHHLLELIKMFINRGGNPNCQNSDGEILLIHLLTIARGALEEMDGASLQSLFTALNYLISKHKPHVESLIFVTSSGYSVLHLALSLLGEILTKDGLKDDDQQNIAKNCLDSISSILSQCLKPSAITCARDSVEGKTLLHMWAALQWGCGQENNDDSDMKLGCSIEAIVTNIAEQLLSHGADKTINGCDNAGRTPLHMAEKWSAAKFLLNKGASRNVTDQRGNTPLASYMRNLVNHHVSSSPGQPLLTICNTMNNSPSIELQWKEVLRYGMDPWKANAEGSTVLGELLRIDASHVVKGFLKVTQDPLNEEVTERSPSQQYPVDSNGNTPLQTICQHVGETHFWKLELIDNLLKSDTSMVNHQNVNGETALHILCQSEVGSAVCSKLAHEVIQLLRKCNADIKITNFRGKTCLDIAEGNAELTEALKRKIDIKEMKHVIPWSSKSVRHRHQLAEVACRQNSYPVKSFCVHEQPIGKGAFGSVYPGLTTEDGREVAIKKIYKNMQCVVFAEREKLVDLGISKYVVQYLSSWGDRDFEYIALELMEGNLTELIDTGEFKGKEVGLCRDVVGGLKFLHGVGYLHRDIKPGNILYKDTPELHLKLADFGWSKKNPSNLKGSSDLMSSVRHSNDCGTENWKAPELFQEEPQYSRRSDMFSCGIVLHYLLSGKKHPFESQTKAGKSPTTQENIKDGNMTIAEELNAEAHDLVKQLLSSDKGKRPSASDALKHPYFWTNLKKVNFVKEVGNQPEIGVPWHSKHRCGPASSVETDLENAFGPQLAILKSWDAAIPLVHSEMTKKRKYQTKSAVDLVRMFRNAHSHLPELTNAARKEILDDQIFFHKFPDFVIFVYNAVRDHGWDTRKDIAAVLNAGDD